MALLKISSLASIGKSVVCNISKEVPNKEAADRRAKRMKMVRKGVESFNVVLGWYFGQNLEEIEGASKVIKMVFHAPDTCWERNGT